MSLAINPLLIRSARLAPMILTAGVLAGEPITGAVSWISTEVSDKTRTVQVRAEVANPDGRLRARMFGRAAITIASKPSALAVPATAVQPDGHANLVFVRLNEEVYRPRVVTLGGR